MPGKGRYSKEQIIAKLREADVLLSQIDLAVSSSAPATPGRASPPKKTSLQLQAPSWSVSLNPHALDIDSAPRRIIPNQFFSARSIVWALGYNDVTALAYFKHFQKEAG